MRAGAGARASFFNFKQQVPYLLLCSYIHGWRDRKSRNLLWKLGLPFFWISCRVWRVELRLSFVACLLGNRAPLRIDGAGRFVSNLPALNHTGGEKKIHRIVENM